MGQIFRRQRPRSEAVEGRDSGAKPKQVQVQVQVELYCHSAACGDIQWNEMSCLTGPRCYINTDIQHYKPIHKLTY